MWPIKHKQGDRASFSPNCNSCRIKWNIINNHPGMRGKPGLSQANEDTVTMSQVTVPICVCPLSRLSHARCPKADPQQPLQSAPLPPGSAMLRRWEIAEEEGKGGGEEGWISSPHPKGSLSPNLSMRAPVTWTLPTATFSTPGDCSHPRGGWGTQLTSPS